MIPTTAAPARLSRRRAATRDRLLDAALEVFARAGSGRATIEAVCEAAGFTRGAFYSNFATLDELFLALAAREVEALTSQVQGALADLEAPASVPAVVDRVLAALRVDHAWTLLRTEAALRASRDPDFARAWAAHRRTTVEALAEALAPAVAVLDLPAPLADPARLAEAVQALHDGVMVDLVVVEGFDAARSRLRELLVVLLTR